MNENLDHITEEKEQNLNQDRLERLGHLCLVYKELEKEILEKEENLKSIKKELEVLSRIDIPSILNEVGLKEVKLSTGEKVIVEDKLKSSITNKNYALAYSNMIKQEGGDEEAKNMIDSLFKTKTILENVSEEILDLLLDKDVEYDIKKEIPWQTLNKYCKERLGQGKEIPEGISVFQYQETKIK